MYGALFLQLAKVGTLFDFYLQISHFFALLCASVGALFLFYKQCV